MSKPAKKATAVQIFRAYYRVAQQYPLLFGCVLLGTIGVQGAALLSPLYLRNFFNLLVSYDTSVSNIHQLTVIVVIVGAIYFFSWITQRIQFFSIMLFEGRVMPDLYLSAFEHLLGHSYQFFISQFAGTLTRRVSKFSDAFEALFDTFMMTFIPTTLFVLGAVIILFIDNHTLGLVLLAWVVVFVSFQIYVSRLRQPLRIKRSEEDSKMVGALADAISNQNTITLFGGASHEYGIFHDFIDIWHKATMRSWFADEYIS